MLLIDCTLATMVPGEGWGLISDGAVAVAGDRIAWAGRLVDCPVSGEVQRLEGRLVTPGLIDCHTHIVHGGSRVSEFEMRLNGASYEEIARAGGGIVSTVAATREGTVDDLVAQALPRVDSFLAEGVTVLEVKSGYGLDIETECRMLRAARALGRRHGLRVVTSFLGAHALPPGFSDKDAYIDKVCIPALKAAHAEGLVDAVDGFCEHIAFTPDQIARVFDVARSLGLPLKLHAEQLSHQGGTALAARYGALSADHLEYATDEDAAAMAEAGTVAVLLPGAYYTLRESKAPPVNAFRRRGVPIALATDCNPGSSPMTSLLLAMNMGCTLFGLTPQEAMDGVTRNAARALGLSDCGTIEPGKRADLAVWDVEHPAELAYRIGFNPLRKRIFGGQTC